MASQHRPGQMSVHHPPGAPFQSPVPKKKKSRFCCCPPADSPEDHHPPLLDNTQHHQMQKVSVDIGGSDVLREQQRKQNHPTTHREGSHEAVLSENYSSKKRDSEKYPREEIIPISHPDTAIQFGCSRSLMKRMSLSSSRGLKNFDADSIPNNTEVFHIIGSHKKDKNLAGLKYSNSGALKDNACENYITWDFALVPNGKNSQNAVNLIYWVSFLRWAVWFNHHQNQILSLTFVLDPADFPPRELDETKVEDEKTGVVCYPGNEDSVGAFVGKVAWERVRLFHFSTKKEIRKSIEYLSGERGSSRATTQPFSNEVVHEPTPQPTGPPGNLGSATSFSVPGPLPEMNDFNEPRSSIAAAPRFSFHDSDSD